MGLTTKPRQPTGGWSSAVTPIESMTSFNRMGWPASRESVRKLEPGSTVCRHGRYRFQASDRVLRTWPLVADKDRATNPIRLLDPFSYLLICLTSHYDFKMPIQTMVRVWLFPLETVEMLRAFRDVRGWLSSCSISIIHRLPFFPHSQPHSYLLDCGPP